jgi:hypothetical protein
MSQDQITEKENAAKDAWAITPQLRWNGTVLEQRWICYASLDTKYEWRPVPQIVGDNVTKITR